MVILPECQSQRQRTLIQIDKIHSNYSAGARSGHCNPSYWEARVWDSHIVAKWQNFTIGIHIK